MNQAKTLFFLLGIPLFLILLGDLIAGEAGVVFSVAISILMYFTAWNANGVILRLYHAREANPEEITKLKTLVTALTQKANLPIPKIYLISDDSPNAFSIGRNINNAGLVLTTGLLDVLDEDELTAVLAHELSHIKHHDTLITTISAAVAGFFTSMANTATWKKLLDEKQKVADKINPTAMQILAPIASILIKISTSGEKEFQADRDGAALCDHPKALASALTKIEKSKEDIVFTKAELLPATAHLFFVNPLQPSKIADLFAIQPPTAERIRQLEAIK